MAELGFCRNVGAIFRRCPATDRSASRKIANRPNLDNYLATTLAFLLSLVVSITQPCMGSLHMAFQIILIKELFLLLLSFCEVKE